MQLAWMKPEKKNGLMIIGNVLLFNLFCPMLQGEIKILFIVWSENSLLNNLKWTHEEYFNVSLTDFISFVHMINSRFVTVLFMLLKTWPQILIIHL